MRSSVNPLHNGDEYPGHDLEDQEGQAPAAQQSPTQLSSTDGTTERWRAELAQHDGLRRVLKFSGTVFPQSRCSPGWIPCSLWPFSLVVVIAGAMWIVWVDWTQARTFMYVVDLPILFGAGSALVCCVRLPIIAKRVIIGWSWSRSLDDESRPMAMLTSNDLNKIARLSVAYTVLWISLGFALWINDITAQNIKLKIWGVLPYIWIEWIHLCAPVPVLGALLLILGIDAALATNKVKILLVAAREGKLTREAYKITSDDLKKRTASWQWTLGPVALSSLWNTVGLMYILHQPRIDIYASELSTLSLDLHHVLYLGKEVTVFFAILALMMGVNDNADSIAAVLNSETWGDGASEEEATRQDLLLLATTYSITPESATSMRAYVTKPRIRPISFRVCGIRPTKDLFVSCVASLIVSLISILFKRLFKDGLS